MKDVTNMIRVAVDNNNTPVKKTVAGLNHIAKEPIISNSNTNTIPQIAIATRSYNAALREQAIYKPEALKLKQQQEAIMKRIREFVQKHPEYKKVDYMAGNVHIIYEGPYKCITDKGEFIVKSLKDCHGKSLAMTR